MEIVSAKKPITGHIELIYDVKTTDSDFYFGPKREEPKKSLLKKIIDFFFKEKADIKINNVINSKITINNK